MAFKGLQINRDKIKDTILEYSENVQVTINEISGEMHNYTITVPGEKACLLSFYFLKGTTTIQAVKNRNSELGEQIAQLVIDKCAYPIPGIQTLHKKDLSEQHFLELLDYVKICNVQVSAPVEIPYGQKYNLIAKDGGEATVSRYSNNAVMVQGKSVIIRLLMIDILSELLPFKEVIDIQLESINVNKSVGQVLDELEEVIPEAFAYMGDTLKAIIAPSVVLRHLDAPVEDHTFILYPVLRGLEGFIKKMFSDKGIEVGQSFGGHITYDGKTDTSIISAQHVDIFNINEINAIESAYKYYRKNRHGLFHVDGGIDTTRIVETKSEALDILGEIFDIFEYSCKKYHE
jgi:hypothetical protein